MVSDLYHGVDAEHGINNVAHVFVVMVLAVLVAKLCVTANAPPITIVRSRSPSRYAMKKFLQVVTRICAHGKNLRVQW